MTYTITTRQTKIGTAFDLYVRWIRKRYRPLLGYNLTQEEADQRAIALIAEIQAGPQTTPVQHAPRTLRDLVPLFWHSFDVKHRIDRVRPKGIINQHIVPVFGNRFLSSLTPKEGLDYILKRQQAHASAGTIRREWQVLMRLLNFAVRYDWLDKHRLKGVELPDGGRRTRVAMPPELEGIRLLRDRAMPEVLRELCRVVVAELNTGLRESKLLAVHRPGSVRKLMDGGLFYHRVSLG